MAAEKSCKLAPCCARFRRILSAPIDSMAEISYSLISQFCVDRIEIAHVSCHDDRREKLRANPMLRSFPPNSVRTNRFYGRNKL